MVVLQGIQRSSVRNEWQFYPKQFIGEMIYFRSLSVITNCLYRAEFHCSLTGTFLFGRPRLPENKSTVGIIIEVEIFRSLIKTNAAADTGVVDIKLPVHILRISIIFVCHSIQPP